MNTPADPTLSVIVPTLNEARHLPSLLKALNAQQNVSLEIVVSDAGSVDGTPALAAEAGVIVIQAPRGRGVQMNTGARQAKGDYLLFLHADSGITDARQLSRAVAALGAAIAEHRHNHIAGHFQIRFRRSTNHNTLAYRYAEEKTALNRPYTTNGDQGFLLERQYFETLGGFDESLPFLEDQRLAEKIRGGGVWITLPGMLETSARRFETEGFHRRYFLMAMIMGLHYAGVDEFFRLAPHVYRAQHETGQLLLTPFFRLIRGILRNRERKQRLAVWLRVGRFVRHNSWQLFFFLDVLARRLIGPGRYPVTVFHDRAIWPLINFRFCDGITAALAFVWVMGVLQGFFRLREWRALSSARG